jgi:selenophosphate synthase
VAWGAVDDATRAALIDPQTSGGLLVSVPRPRLGEFLDRVPGAVAIGDVDSPGERPLIVE